MVDVEEVLLAVEAVVVAVVEEVCIDCNSNSMDWPYGASSP